MTTLRRVLPLLLVPVLALTLASCSSARPSKADAAIDAANKRIAEYNDRDAEIVTLSQRADAVEFTPEGAKEGMALAEEMTALCTDQKATIQAARAEFDKIAEMDVSAELKTYAKMQSEIASKQFEMDAIVGEMSQDLRGLFELFATKKANKDNVAVFGTAAQEKSAKVNALDAEVKALQQQADKYFDDNDLGR